MRCALFTTLAQTNALVRNTFPCSELTLVFYDFLPGSIIASHFTSHRTYQRLTNRCNPPPQTRSFVVTVGRQNYDGEHRENVTLTRTPTVQ